MPSQRSFSPWQYLDPLGVQTGGVPGNAPKTFPIAAAPEPWFRDRLDALRSARIPTAMYPDGYIETFRTRREDRLRGPQPRQTQRSYQRGIHVGARVDPQSYFWPENVNPEAGIEAEARGEKWTAQGEYFTHLINDGKPGPVRGSAGLDAQPVTLSPRMDPQKQEWYRRLAPTWR